MENSEPAIEPIAREVSGTADEPHLNILIGEAWSTVLDDPKEKAEIAALLGVAESELDPKQPPFHAEIIGSGVTGAEVLIALASGFVLGLAKDSGSAAGKAASKKLRELWADFMRDRVSPPGSGKLGAPRYDADEG
jgi:hypothetical protein